MKKSKFNPRKTAIIQNLSTSLSRAKAFFLTDYKSLTHKQLEELRKNLKKDNAEYSIVKNTLLKKSLESSSVKNKESLYDSLKESTAALFAYGDALSAIKTLSAFIKTYTLPKIKIGIFSENLISADEFNRLASLPAKEVLLAILAARLRSPISGLHYALNWNLQKFVTVLNNIKNKKPN